MSLLLLSLIFLLSLCVCVCICYTPDTKDTYVTPSNLFNTISTGKKLVSDKNKLKDVYYTMYNDLHSGIVTTSIKDDRPFMQSTYDRQKTFFDSLFYDSKNPLSTVSEDITSNLDSLIGCIEPPYNDKDQAYTYKTTKFINSSNRCQDCNRGGRCYDGYYEDCSAKRFNNTNDGICKYCPLGSTSSKHPEICEPCQNGTYTDRVSEIKGCSSCTPGYFNQGTGNFLDVSSTTWSVPPAISLRVNMTVDYYGNNGEILRDCKVVAITYPPSPTLPTQSNAIAEILTKNGGIIKDVPYSLLLPKQFGCLRCPTGNFCNTVTDFPIVFTQSNQTYNSIDTALINPALINPVTLKKYLPIPGMLIDNELIYTSPTVRGAGAGQTGNFSYIGKINKAGHLNRIKFTGELLIESKLSCIVIFIVDVFPGYYDIIKTLTKEFVNSNSDKDTSTWTTYKKNNYTDTPTSSTISLKSPNTFSFNFEVDATDSELRDINNVTTNSHVILYITAANDPTTKATTYTSITNSILSLYIDEKQNSTYSTITQCPIGSYCPTLGLTTPTTCPVGSYCPSVGLTTPKKCDIGSYNSITGKKLSTDCLICPTGSYCPTLGTDKPTKCDIGSYNSITGKKLLTDCQICPTGSYCPTLGLSVPTKCPIGSYNSITGKKLLIDCLICPPGSYCPTLGLSVPTNCPIGTYNSATGKKLLSDCLICPIGSYCPTLGLSAPTKCPAGSFCHTAGLSLPSLTCNPGSYCPLIGQGTKTSSNQLTCPQKTNRYGSLENTTSNAGATSCLFVKDAYGSEFSKDCITGCLGKAYTTQFYDTCVDRTKAEGAGYGCQ